MFHFLFPAGPLDPRTIDDDFAPQRDALSSAGFTTSLVTERTFDDGAAVRGLPEHATVVYRGWMVDVPQYERLARAVEGSGASMLTSPGAYRRAHHLPEWYPQLRDLTPETVVFPPDADLEVELPRLGWGEYFVKDYVKSLKTAPGPIVRAPGEGRALAAAMLRYRGTIEGGFCVRRVERFEPASERRFFVYVGRAFGDDVPDIVQTVAARIDCPFFSVDVARNESGAWRVVEIGDGQVSDLVGWSVEAFVNVWAAPQSPPSPSP